MRLFVYMIVLLPGLAMSSSPPPPQKSCTETVAGEILCLEIYLEGLDVLLLMQLEDVQRYAKKLNTKVEIPSLNKHNIDRAVRCMLKSHLSATGEYRDLAYLECQADLAGERFDQLDHILIDLEDALRQQSSR